MATNRTNPTASDVTQLINDVDLSIDSSSESISKAREGIAKLESLAERQSSWSGFWAKIGAFTAVVAGITTLAAYLQSRKESATNGRLRKADQILSALELGAQKIAIAEVEKQAADAKSALEVETQKRLQLEKDVAPRSIEQSKSSQALRIVPGITALLAHVPEFESKKTAGQLAFLFNMSGWSLAQAGLADDLAFDGISVFANAGPHDDDDHSRLAAMLLVAELKKMGVEASMRPERGLPKNTISVIVGMKPQPYLQDRDEPEWARKLQQDGREALDKILQESLEYELNRLKTQNAE